MTPELKAEHACCSCLLTYKERFFLDLLQGLGQTLQGEHSAAACTPLLLWTAVCLACWTAGLESGRDTPTCSTYTFPRCKYAQSGQFQLAIVRRLMKTLWNCELALFGSQQMKPSLDSPPFRSVPWEGNADDNMESLVQKFPEEPMGETGSHQACHWIAGAAVTFPTGQQINRHPLSSTVAPMKKSISWSSWDLHSHSRDSVWNVYPCDSPSS